MGFLVLIQRWNTRQADDDEVSPKEKRFGFFDVSKRYVFSPVRRPLKSPKKQAASLAT
jgi:hypothetical protein